MTYGIDENLNKSNLFAKVTFNIQYLLIHQLVPRELTDVTTTLLRDLLKRIIETYNDILFQIFSIRRLNVANIYLS